MAALSYSKMHFGKLFHMEIKEGPPGKGPIFEVREDGSDEVFQGNTPTKPWTEVCLRSTSTGTRVSGPLFFGFSDPISQKLIKMLELNVNQSANQADTNAKDQPDELARSESCVQ